MIPGGKGDVEYLFGDDVGVFWRVIKLLIYGVAPKHSFQYFVDLIYDKLLRFKLPNDWAD